MGRGCITISMGEGARKILGSAGRMRLAVPAAAAAAGRRWADRERSWRPARPCRNIAAAAAAAAADSGGREGTAATGWGTTTAASVIYNITRYLSREVPHVINLNISKSGYLENSIQS